MPEHTDEMNRNVESSQEHQDYAGLFETEQKRRRGLQSKTDKLTHENLVLKKQLEVLQAQAGPQLTSEQIQELNELKYSDPDTYYVKRQSMEEAAGKERDEQLKALGDEVAKEVKMETLGTRLVEAKKALSEKIEGFAEVVNPETVSEYVPPMITKQYEEGKLDATQFLEKAYAFITAEEVLDKKTPSAVPSLNSVAGGQIPTDQAIGADINASYDKVIF